MTKAFRASRYGRGQEEDGDYINCPLDRPGYEAFVAALLEAEASTPRDFEADIFFEGCLPIEIIAARGPREMCIRDRHCSSLPREPAGVSRAAQ